jgi:hypothetical protein
MRSLNWRRTPLGPAQDWPRNLKTAVRIIPTSRQPIWIGWGPELATNAVKYGALSNDEGRVDINWSIDQAKKSFALDWVESGGTAVRPRQKRGFGSGMFARGLA